MLTDEQLARLVAELRYVQTSLAQLKEQDADLKARLRDGLAGVRGPVRLHGQHVLTVAYRKVFSEPRAFDILTEAEVRLVTEPIITAVKARALLSPDRYAACQVESETPTITLAKS